MVEEKNASLDPENLPNQKFFLGLSDGSIVYGVIDVRKDGTSNMGFFKRLAELERDLLLLSEENTVNTPEASQALLQYVQAIIARLIAISDELTTRPKDLG